MWPAAKTVTMKDVCDWLLSRKFGRRSPVETRDRTVEDAMRMRMQLAPVPAIREDAVIFGDTDLTFLDLEDADFRELLRQRLAAYDEAIGNLGKARSDHAWLAAGFFAPLPIWFAVSQAVGMDLQLAGWLAIPLTAVTCLILIRSVRISRDRLTHCRNVALGLWEQMGLMVAQSAAISSEALFLTDIRPHGADTMLETQIVPFYDVSWMERRDGTLHIYGRGGRPVAWIVAPSQEAEHLLSTAVASTLVPASS